MAKDQPARSGLKELLEDLSENLIPWYESTAAWNWWLWHICSALAIVCGLSASVIAGFMARGALQEHGWWLLITLPALGSLAATALGQYRFKEIEDLRETGRIEAQDLADWAYGELTIAADEARCHEIYEQVRKQLKELEVRQNRRSHEIAGHRRKRT